MHCGFCLPRVRRTPWGEEMDSPRGRIHLVTQLLDGAPRPRRGRPLRPLPRLHGVHDRLPLGGAVRPDHRGGQGVDRGRGAVRAGSPVRGRAPGRRALGPALGAGCGGAGAAAGARARRDRRRRAVGGPADQGLDLRAVPLPARLRVALAPLRLAQRTGADRLLARSGLLAACHPPPTRRCGSRRPGRPAAARAAAARVTARGPRRAVVGMLTGCVQSVFFPASTRPPRGCWRPRGAM